MTGSARNIGSTSILPGSPLAEDAAGNVMLTDGVTLPAFAVATDGAPPNGIVSYTTEGILTLNDWSQIVGSRTLKPGQAYFVGSKGKISASGQQQVGVARSGSDLRVSIQAFVPAVSTFWPVTTDPASHIGDVNDFAMDLGRNAIWHKTTAGWKLIGTFLKIADSALRYAPAGAFVGPNGNWQWIGSS